MSVTEEALKEYFFLVEKTKEELKKLGHTIQRKPMQKALDDLSLIHERLNLVSMQSHKLAQLIIYCEAAKNQDEDIPPSFVG